MAGKITTIKSKKFVAVDFDSAQLRVVAAQRAGGKLRVSQMRAFPIPEKFNTTEPQSMGLFLGAAIKKMRLSNLPVLMTIRRADAVLKPISLPPGTQANEFAGMVRFQMASELPFSAEEAVIDFIEESHFDAGSSTRLESGSIKLLVAAVRLPVIDYYRQVAQAADVKLAGLGLRPWANQRCVQLCAGSVVNIDDDDLGDISGVNTRSTLLVNVTADDVEIDIINGSSLTFSRSADVQAGSIASADDTAIVKCKEAIAIEVSRSIDGYSVVEGAREIDSIVVAGATGLEAGLAAMFGEKFDIPSSLLTPAEVISIRGSLPEGGISSFVTTFGLALEAVAGDRQFDFLNPKKPVVKRDTRQTKILLGIVATGVAIMFLYLGSSAYLKPRKRINTLLRAKISKLKKEKKVRDTRLDYYRALQEWDSTVPIDSYLDHINFIIAMLPSSDEIVLRKFETGRFFVRFRAMASSPEVLRKLQDDLAAKGYEIDRKGIATDDKDLRYGYYDDITIRFKSSTKPDWKDVSASGRPRDDISSQKGYQ